MDHNSLSNLLLNISLFTYLGSTILYLAYFIFRSPMLGLGGTIATIGGFIVQTSGIIRRWVESYQMGPNMGHAPLSNMYESLVFFAWSIALIYIFLEYRSKNRLLGAFVMPFAFLSMALGSLLNKDIQPLVNALQSNWLIAHVVTCFLGYAAFAIACGLGIMYLLKATQSKEDGLLAALPPQRWIEDLTHKTILFGFLLLTAGIITGAIWANSAWGTYWSWDPKETWSLITWFIYGATLHARFTKGWGGKRIAWLAVLGFLSVIFTYYGVNFLLSGLHSYGSN